MEGSRLAVRMWKDPNQLFGDGMNVFITNNEAIDAYKTGDQTVDGKQNWRWGYVNVKKWRLIYYTMEEWKTDNATVEGKSLDTDGYNTHDGTV